MPENGATEMGSGSNDSFSDKWLAIGLGALLVLGGALRIEELDARSIWFDEAFSWRLIQFPFLDMIERVALDNNPPLYFIALQVWASVFGDSTFALRMLSVTFGVATIFGTYLMVREGRFISARDSGRVPALIAAAMIALSVFHIRFACEIRMYTLGTALAVFSTAALFRALGLGGARSWFSYAVLALAFAYAHYYAFFTIAAQYLFAVGYLAWRSGENRPKVPRFEQFVALTMAAVFMVIGYLPWLSTFLFQWSKVRNDFWISDVRLFVALNLCFEMLVSPENADRSWIGGSFATLICSCILLRLLWKPTPITICFFCCAVVPLVLCLALSWWNTRVFLLRYFLFAHTFMFAGLGVLIGRIADTLTRSLVVATVALLLLVSHLAFVDALDVSNRPGGRAASRYIQESRTTEERVIVCSPVLFFSVIHHASDRSNWYVFGRTREFPHYEGASILFDGEVVTPADLQAMKKGTAWVVDTTGYGTREVAVPDSWVLEEEKRFREVLRAQGETIVRRYEIRSD